MYVWTVVSYLKDTDQIDEISQPFISAKYAMKDWLFNHLDWKHIESPKFGGAVLEHWQAEDEEYNYVLEAQHVGGSE